VLLSDGDLRKEIANERLVLDPWDPAMLQPSSIDVRLDRYFRVFQNSRYTHIDPSQQQDELTTPVEPADEEPFVLHPGEFVLGSTFESVSLPDDLAGRLEGKSSLGRLGLLTHSTAGFIDPGFTGHITLELSNVANLPITLWPGMKIGQLCLFRLSSPAERPYGSAGVGSRYQGQRGPTPSRAHLTLHRADTQRSPPRAEMREIAIPGPTDDDFADLYASAPKLGAGGAPGRGWAGRVVASTARWTDPPPNRPPGCRCRARWSTRPPSASSPLPSPRCANGPFAQ